MPLPRLPKPPSARELRTTENQLARILKAGLAREGLQTRPSRECTIFVELDDRIEIWISAYEDDLRWWRITWASPSHQTDPSRFGLNELTMHRDEITEDTGGHLAMLLRDPDYKWPLFAKWNDYPRYAWSDLAYETHREFRKMRDAWSERVAKRRRPAR